MAIYDTMQSTSAPVSTTAVGLTASFGTTVLISGAPGMRYALPNATIHIHQPLMMGAMQGQASDIVIRAKEIQRLKERLLDIFVERTGQPRETLDRDMDRDKYFDAKEAVEYGLVDGVTVASVAQKIPRLNGNGNGKH